MTRKTRRFFRHVVGNLDLEAKLADMRRTAARKCPFAAQAIERAAERRERLRARPQGAYGLD